MKKINAKRVFAYISVFLGLFCIVYYFGIIILSRVSFSKFFLAFGVLLIIIGATTLFMDGRYLPKKVSFMVKIIKIMVIIIVVSFIILESLIVYNGNKTDKASVDYLVILGAGLWGDSPSLALQERLDESLKFIKVNPNVKVILSGGKGPGETITEAEGMRRYLIDHGVSEKQLIKEENSTSTKENMQFTKNLLNNIDGRKHIKIKIVTNNFHMFRAKLLARNSGFIAYGEPSVLYPLLIPAYYTREYLAVIKTLIFDLS
jgi:uncharacterized SAM-binding protein YcdF (DUF218 family)